MLDPSKQILFFLSFWIKIGNFKKRIAKQINQSLAN